ncbi:MAG: hypothetical protein KA974_01485 [Saprospiraceae bacterium]|nr:hypothetical protein [Saprospiraceae bacterium]MBP7699419.1 hypothetical protein [Saprospiraceae bacterium]
MNNHDKLNKQPTLLQFGKDYYIENGYWVFTEHFLRERGYCCSSGCRHCPYKYTEQPSKSEAFLSGQ